MSCILMNLELNKQVWTLYFYNSPSNGNLFLEIVSVKLKFSYKTSSFDSLKECSRLLTFEIPLAWINCFLRDF